MRNVTARTQFLHSHGFDSVPDGYEVHHIVPLCEGGADSPDNMIIIKKEEHDIITATHSRYYGCNTTDCDSQNNQQCHRHSAVLQMYSR